ncbi:DUF6414 family protein [Tepidibacter formicigenes]|jgi:hypothetical protein|uniref:Uncharacterized protein n=1 Tax=Tepidibacter formicigenes DSM 15518 TaxID=1123349 RepID=A0A1M6N8I7_9FIRM|nr:hypothetical protein [Tepidibacter formicigenes]SHJ91977.1 hypothetical protein SAMN02744037_01183 [Tepidibacter formicigenes DSM 15518]
MGETERNCQQNTLIDFIYRDNNLIDSFYSQIFSGNLSAITKTETISDEIATGIDGSIKVLKGNVATKENSSQTLTSNIDPHDFKLLNLISELNIEIINDRLMNCPEKKLVAIKGNLIFRDYAMLNKLIPFITESGMIPGFDSPVIPNSRGKNKKFTIGKLMEKMISFIPNNIEFELITDTDESATIIIKEEFLTLSPNEILISYGKTLPSEWTVVGLLDANCSNTIKSKCEFKNNIDDLSKVYFEMLNEDKTNKFVIRPIAIYRHISY